MIAAKPAGVRLEPDALRALRKIAPARFLAALAGDYAVIALCLFIGRATLAGAIWTWAAWPLLWAVIASRQHALLVLMHDASHTLAFKRSAVNDAVGELFCAGPLFISMFAYRRDHLAHHKWTNDARDPDWRFKLEDAGEREAWMFPRRNRSFAYWPALWARAVRFQFKLLSGNAKGGGEKVELNPYAKRLVQIRLGSYVALAVALTAFGWWPEYLLFWMVPAFVGLPFIMRLRSIAEHFALTYASELSETRTVVFKSRPEKFLLAPHNVSYHLDHHLFSAIPFYRLPQLHALLGADPAYKAGAHINDGYFIGARTLNHDLLNAAPTRELWPARA